MLIRQSNPLAAFASVLASLFFAHSAQSLDERRLWLPKKHKDLQPYLVEAARQAEAFSYCNEVLSGKLGGKKKDKQKRFVITCRDMQRKSFNAVFVLAEENGKKIVRPSEEALRKGIGATGDKTLTPINIATLSMLEKRQICIDNLVRKTRNMTAVNYLGASADSIVEGDTEGFEYRAAFDAKNLADEHLTFYGVCQFTKTGVANISIIPR